LNFKKSGAIFVSVTLLFAVGSIGASAADNPSNATVITCQNSVSTGHNPPVVAAPTSIANPLPRTITLITNCGNITIRTLENAVPVTLSALSALAKGNFYDNTNCHRMTTSGLYVIQCGDPTETGSGSPGFAYVDENLPKATVDNYLNGYVAMANSGPNTNGSQFFITYKPTTLSPNYSIWGKVIQGMEIVNYIASKGVSGGRADGPLAFKLEIRDVVIDQFAALSLKQLQDYYLESISTSNQSTTLMNDLYGEIASYKSQVGVLSSKNEELANSLITFKSTIDDLNTLVSQTKQELQKIKGFKTIVCKKGNKFVGISGNPAKCPAGYLPIG
jgi:peptidyl-prolyl cis-trans isomerase B (cyclophilin B)